MKKEKDNSTEFIHQLTGYKLNYISLLYSNVVLASHLTENKLKDCIKSQDFIVGVSHDKTDGLMNLNSELINSEFKKFLNLMNIPYSQQSIEILCKLNVEKSAHFLRTRILNAIYEEISYFFENNKKEMSKLHTYNWFQVLYILRNNASHNNNLNRIVHFPKWNWLLSPYPEKIKWNKIEILNGQYGHEIRYNDKEIIELVECTIDYFENLKNESKN